jgi:hypothetical protein
VEARVDTNRVTLGDPIALSLRLRYGPDEKPALPSPEEWPAGLWVKPGERQGPRAAGGAQELVQQYQVRLFRLGRQPIPALPVVFVRANGDTVVRTTRPVEIEVISVRGADEEEPRDIKPPLVIAGGIPLWLAVVLGLVGLGLTGGLLYWLFRRRRPREVETPLQPVDHQAEFVRIAGLGLVERGEFKAYYSLLSENLRRYLEHRLGIEAMEQTTTQIVAALRQSDLPEGVVRQIAEYLRAADLVKFARFHPALDSARRAPEAGIALIRGVEQELSSRAAAVQAPVAASERAYAGTPL